MSWRDNIRHLRASGFDPVPMRLLLDALDRTLREPECAARWHGLLATWIETTDQADRQSVLDVLKTAPHSDVRADVLRLTFLARASGEARFESAASLRVLEQEPPDPDRLAAFMAYRWLGALQDTEQRADFAAALSDGMVPELARRAMNSALRLIPRGMLPRVPTAVERIAVVVPYIGNQFHTPSIMAVEQCAVLAREGRQVHIFSAQELDPPDASSYRGDGRRLKLPPLNKKAWSGILPAGVAMTVSDIRYSLPGRWENLLPVLADFDPDVVLLVGLYSPLAAALHTLRPVVGISVNTVPPIAPMDVWLTADPEVERRDVWGGVFPAPQPIYHPYRVRRSTKNYPVTRLELGANETTVVWVTAGFRLEHEIKGEWACRIVQFLAGHPQVTWLLVGGEGQLPEALRQAAPGRVRALATREDLPGILRCADIYVNPPRMGGGFSVAEAMAEGLPVTSFAGSDGGDKVGDLALPDMDAYMQRLDSLTGNPDLRSAMGLSLRQRFAERFDLQTSGPALLAACRQAAELAKPRLTRPS